MFRPQYVITNKILENLIALERAALVVEMAPLQTDWEIKLKQECLSRRMNSVLRYLGVQLGLDDVTKIINDDPGRDDKPTQVAVRAGVVGKEIDIQKTINWLNANKLVDQTAYMASKFKQEPLELKDLMTINSLLGERIVSSNELREYRSEKSSEMAEVKAPPVIEVAYQMEDFFSWLKGTDKREYHAVIKAGAVLFEILRIRPFAADNMTTGLFVFGLILASEGLGFKGILAYEEEILKNKQRLEEVVAITVNSEDLTGWFEFLTRELADAAEKTKVKVMNLVGDGPIFKTERGKAISLTERQIVIMEEMTIQGEMTIKEIRAILPMVSDDTILRDLKDLMAKKLIKKKGKTKGAVYVLGKVKGFK